MNKFSNICENTNFIDVNCVNLNSELLYITENNKQVGSLILCYTAEGKASVFSVAILEKFRGKGYSKQLMNKAIDRAKEKGCILIELNTEVTNEVANNLYQKMGFELKGLMDDYNNYQLVL
jgi:ribosomal protein S18 acetylase RimI-like enzyme